ncbi:MAG: mRNA surveillance protein pelota [Candidatus Bathyarchaeia archaeon]
MRVLKEDLKHGSITVEIDNLNDLWNIYNIVEENDLIFAKSMREIKHEEAGRPSSKRVSIYVGLKVIRTFFDRQLNRLRVHGLIIQAPEKYAIQGSHHTISLAPESRVTICKEVWLRHHLDRIKRSVKEEEPLAILSLDADEACLAFIHSFDIEIKAQVRSRLPGKSEAKLREEAMKRYFGEIVQAMKTSLTDSDMRVAIFGPGFTKEAFTKYLSHKDRPLFEKVTAVKSSGSGGVGGVYEALRSGLVGAVLKKSRLIEELSIVDELFKKLAENSGDVSYGVQAVAEDANAAAIQTLLLSIEWLKKRTTEERGMIERLIRNVEENGGEVLIVSPGHEGGAKLSSIGGVAAILRYPRHAWERGVE